MSEMSRREGIIAASLKKRADRLPFSHYWRHSQIGWAERECRQPRHGYELEQSMLCGEDTRRRDHGADSLIVGPVCRASDVFYACRHILPTALRVPLANAAFSFLRCGGCANRRRIRPMHDRLARR
jgi:hypothetical protein